jgi:hypothetical protein
MVTCNALLDVRMPPRDVRKHGYGACEKRYFNYGAVINECLALGREGRAYPCSCAQDTFEHKQKLGDQLQGVRRSQLTHLRRSSRASSAALHAATSRSSPRHTLNQDGDDDRGKTATIPSTELQ